MITGVCKICGSDRLTERSHSDSDDTRYTTYECENGHTVMTVMKAKIGSEKEDIAELKKYLNDKSMGIRGSKFTRWLEIVERLEKNE